ncbi:MAG: 30S ribosomal protein S16 [Actinomycetia bacterium]|nr:30S ribosomal protein S16 [Actinomycetes bacterium]
MAVKIKLKRIGKIHIPQYRIVVADARTARSGRAIEEVGQYRPKEEPSFIKVDSDRIQYWLSVGAQPTEPVLALLKITGDWQQFKGLPGAEGTLKVAGQKSDKQAIFDAAAKDAASEQDRLDAFKANAAKKAAAERDAAKAKAEAEEAAAQPAAESTDAEAPAEASSDESAEAAPAADKGADA